MFTCDLCQHEFWFKSCLVLHMKQAHCAEDFRILSARQQCGGRDEMPSTMDPWFCQTCAKSFTSELELSVHVSSCHPMKLDCTFCGAHSFKRLWNLKTHIHRTHGSKKWVHYQISKCKATEMEVKKTKRYFGVFKCYICQVQKFSNRRDLKNHIITFHYQIERYQCEICPFLHHSKLGVQRHASKTHPETSEAGFLYVPEFYTNSAKKGETCSHALVDTVLAYFMEKHKKKRHPEVELNIAKKQFLSKKLCPKQFESYPLYRYPELLAHFQSSHEAALTCDVCGQDVFGAMLRSTYVFKKSVQKWRLATAKKDLKYIDSAKANPNFRCHKCLKICETRDTLRNHIISSHLQAKTYNCPYCSKVFLLRKRFLAHVNICHNSVKKADRSKLTEIFCSMCNAVVLSNRAHLHEHIKLKHPSEPKPVPEPDLPGPISQEKSDLSRRQLQNLDQPNPEKPKTVQSDILKSAALELGLLEECELPGPDISIPDVPHTSNPSSPNTQDIDVMIEYNLMKPIEPIADMLEPITLDLNLRTVHLPNQNLPEKKITLQAEVLSHSVNDARQVPPPTPRTCDGEKYSRDHVGSTDIEGCSESDIIEISIHAAEAVSTKPISDKVQQIIDKIDSIPQDPTTKLYSCYICSSTEKSPAKLKSHVLYVHYNIEQYSSSCLEHNKERGSQTQLPHHSEKHYKKQNRTDKIATTAPSIPMLVTSVAFLCKFCQDCFVSRPQLFAHLNSRHKFTSLKPVCCTIRDYFRTILKLHHAFEHTDAEFESPRPCAVEYKYKSLTDLAQHYRTFHQLDARCTRCKFDAKANVQWTSADLCLSLWERERIEKFAKNVEQAQRNTHSLQFMCMLCNSGHPNKVSLQAHIYSVHFQLKRWKCDLCHVTVYSTKDMVQHQHAEHGAMQFRAKPVSPMAMWFEVMLSALEFQQQFDIRNASQSEMRINPTIPASADSETRTAPLIKTHSNTSRAERNANTNNSNAIMSQDLARKEYTLVKMDYDALVEEKIEVKEEFSLLSALEMNENEQAGPNELPDEDTWMDSSVSPDEPVKQEYWTLVAPNVLCREITPMDSAEICERGVDRTSTRQDGSWNSVFPRQTILLPEHHVLESAGGSVDQGGSSQVSDPLALDS